MIFSIRPTLANIMAQRTIFDAKMFSRFLCVSVYITKLITDIFRHFGSSRATSIHVECSMFIFGADILILIQSLNWLQYQHMIQSNHICSFSFLDRTNHFMCPSSFILVCSRHFHWQNPLRLRESVHYENIVFIACQFGSWTTTRRSSTPLLECSTRYTVNNLHRTFKENREQNEKPTSNINMTLWISKFTNRKWHPNRRDACAMRSNDHVVGSFDIEINTIFWLVNVKQNVTPRIHTHPRKWWKWIFFLDVNSAIWHAARGFLSLHNFRRWTFMNFDDEKSKTKLQ